METVMENDEYAAPSDSSPGTSESNSDKSPTNSSKNSKSVPAEVVGKIAGRSLSYLDTLLTMLQSQLSEIKSSGGGVKLFQRDDGLVILILGTRLCPGHQIIHSDLGCPLCQYGALSNN
jgi:hypothetical protein